MTSSAVWVPEHRHRAVLLGRRHRSDRLVKKWCHPDQVDLHQQHTNGFLFWSTSTVVLLILSLSLSLSIFRSLSPSLFLSLSLSPSPSPSHARSYSSSLSFSTLPHSTFSTTLFLMLSLPLAVKGIVCFFGVSALRANNRTTEQTDKRTNGQTDKPRKVRRRQERTKLTLASELSGLETG